MENAKMSHEDIMKLYYSLDDFDYDNLPVEQRKSEEKECPLCHKSFYACGRNWNRQRYCKRSHFVDYVICGQSILQKEPSEKPGAVRVTCSRECAKKYRAQQTFAAIKDKYGYDNISQVLEFRDKISESIRAKAEETTKKVVATMNRRYGGMGTASPILRKKIEDTMQKRHGVTNPNQSQHKHTISTQHDVIQKLMHVDSRGQWNAPYGGQIHQSFLDKLLSVKINDAVAMRYLDNNCYDILIPGQNIVIEIDSSYTHSNLPNQWDEGKEPNYHLDRSNYATDRGYRCIHVFDWDKWDTIIATISPSKTIYARKCNVYTVDLKQVDEFVQANHLQGNAKGARYACALLYEGEVVSVMTFGKPRYNKNYEWELLRYCTDSKYKITGGASKLFKHFLEDVNPESVLSYCDRAKFTGQVYTKIGMTLHHITPPAKIWSKGSEYITDNLLRQRGYDQLFNTNYGKGTSNEELMIQNGWRSVYDCGQFVYEWRREAR